MSINFKSRKMIKFHPISEGFNVILRFKKGHYNVGSIVYEKKWLSFEDKLFNNITLFFGSNMEFVFNDVRRHYNKGKKKLKMKEQFLLEHYLF